MLISRSRLPWALVAGLAALAVMAVASLGLGAFPLPAREALQALWALLGGGDASVPDNTRAVLMELRLPRIAAAMCVGAALGISGAAFQTVFRNPLVSPDILGVSSGCALGAMVAILLGLPAGAMQAAAFAGGMAAVAAVLAIGARIRSADPVVTLVLTGVVVGSLFSAGVAFAKTIADPYNQLAAMTFWLLGSFGAVLPREIAIALPLMLLGIVPIVALRWRINVLTLQDDEAHALGIDARRLRLATIAAATLATSAAVALVGVIGWVGLVVPHAARLLSGPSFARVLPLSALLGAALMLAVDTLCRTAGGAEIPPGVVTAILGTPAFLALLALNGRRVP